MATMLRRCSWEAARQLEPFDLELARGAYLTAYGAGMSAAHLGDAGVRPRGALALAATRIGTKTSARKWSPTAVPWRSSRQLEQRERVAGCLREDPLANRLVDAARDRGDENVDREEIAQTVDPDLVFDLVYGGLLYRVLVGEPVDEDVARALADLVMNGASGRRYRNGLG
jgi:hypothetical protein